MFDGERAMTEDNNLLGELHHGGIATVKAQTVTAHADQPGVPSQVFEGERAMTEDNDPFVQFPPRRHRDHGGADRRGLCGPALRAVPGV